MSSELWKPKTNGSMALNFNDHRLERDERTIQKGKSPTGGQFLIGNTSDYILIGDDLGLTVA